MKRARLESASAPYDAVDAILITHWHEDHFSPEAVAAHLTRNGHAVLVSSPEVGGAGARRRRSIRPFSACEPSCLRPDNSRP